MSINLQGHAKNLAENLVERLPRLVEVIITVKEVVVVGVGENFGMACSTSRKVLLKELQT